MLRASLSALLALTLAACASFPQAAKQLANAGTTIKPLPIERWHTQAGSQVLFLHTDALPLLDIQLTFAAGSSRDGGVDGLAAFTSALIGEDTRSGLDSDAIARGFDDQGARFSTGSYRDMGVISLRSLTDASLESNLVLFTQVLAPAFRADNVERLRTQLLQGLKSDEETPGPQASKAFWRMVYGQHPYAHNPDGTPASIKAITRQQMQAFYQRFYTAGNAVIALAGNISGEQAHALAERLSAALPAGAAAPALPRAQALPARQLLHVPFASSQTSILIGNVSVDRHAPDYPALLVGEWILGSGGFESRLTHEVREKRGLVYGISAGFSPMAAGGPFTITLKTANASAQQALDLALKVTRDFVARGPTAEEMDKALANLSGSYPLGIAKNSQLVGQLSAIGFYDLPTDYTTALMQAIDKVTAADVRAAMQRHVRVDGLSVVSAGPDALVWPAAVEPAHGDPQK